MGLRGRMSDIKTDTKKHHKVPRLLLNNFASRVVKKTNNPDQCYTWAFNKRNSDIFEPNVLDACAENKFYEPIVDNKLSKAVFGINTPEELDKIALKGLEDAFAHLEDKTAPIIEKIINDKSIANISSEQRQQISFFTSCQFFRTDAFRTNNKIILNSVKEKISDLSEVHCSDLSQTEYPLLDSYTSSENGEKLLHLQSFIRPRGVEICAQLIGDKKWILFQTTKDKPFIIGDCPVALHNENDFGFYGNLGFGLTGIQVYLPITPELTLGFLCDSVIQNRKNLYADNLQKVQNMISHTQSLLVMGRLNNEQRKFLSDEIKSYENNLKLLDIDKSITDSMEQGQAVIVDSERLKFLNHLQVRFAERFLFSSKKDFSLAQKMISDNPKYKFGHNVKVD